jgi:hypothetical protein
MLNRTTRFTHYSAMFSQTIVRCLVSPYVRLASCPCPLGFNRIYSTRSTPLPRIAARSDRRVRAAAHRVDRLARLALGRASPARLANRLKRPHPRSYACGYQHEVITIKGRFLETSKCSNFGIRSGLNLAYISLKSRFISRLILDDVNRLRFVRVCNK